MCSNNVQRGVGSWIEKDNGVSPGTLFKPLKAPEAEAAPAVSQAPEQQPQRKPSTTSLGGTVTRPSISTSTGRNSSATGVNIPR